jgi:hypothetical protein
MAANDPTLKLYSIGIEDFDRTLYEIVLPGRSHGHARQAAKALLALTGPQAFKAFDWGAPAVTGLSAQYKSGAAALLPTLFAAYDVLSQARAALRSETDLYALVEFQIEQARRIVEPSPTLLRAYRLQRGLTRLPPIVVSARNLQHKPANAFQAASQLPRATISAARAFSRTLEQDARDIAALKASVRSEYIQTRKGISGLAKIRMKDIRAEVNKVFRPAYTLARASRTRAVAPRRPNGPQRLNVLAQKVVVTATIMAHQRALRTRLKPALEEKRAAFKRADELHAQFERADRALAASALPNLKRQWRALASDRMRQVHGPQSATPTDKAGPSFLERMALRAGDLRQQSRTTEQNLLPEPD